MSFATEFREFAVKGNVMDLAVGVIIGAAFGKIVDSLVKGLIMPIVGRIFGGAWILVLIAAVNSALAVSIAIQNASTRVFFSMGRIGALPRWLGSRSPDLAS